MVKTTTWVSWTLLGPRAILAKTQTAQAIARAVCFRDFCLPRKAPEEGLEPPTR
jgi:hypothetical protein